MWSTKPCAPSELVAMFGGVVQSAERLSLEQHGYWFESNLPFHARPSFDLVDEERQDLLAHVVTGVAARLSTVLFRFNSGMGRQRFLRARISTGECGPRTTAIRVRFPSSPPSHRRWPTCARGRVVRPMPAKHVYLGANPSERSTRTCLRVRMRLGFPKSKEVVRLHPVARVHARDAFARDEGSVSPRRHRTTSMPAGAAGPF